MSMKLFLFALLCALLLAAPAVRASETEAEDSEFTSEVELAEAALEDLDGNFVNLLELENSLASSEESVPANVVPGSPAAPPAKGPGAFRTRIKARIEKLQEAINDNKSRLDRNKGRRATRKVKSEAFRKRVDELEKTILHLKETSEMNKVRLDKSKARRKERRAKRKARRAALKKQVDANTAAINDNHARLDRNKARRAARKPKRAARAARIDAIEKLANHNKARLDKIKARRQAKKGAAK